VHNSNQAVADTVALSACRWQYFYFYIQTLQTDPNDAPGKWLQYVLKIDYRTKFLIKL
jgi:hypothetical protein